MVANFPRDNRGASRSFNTFSITARCPRTQQLGVAVATSVAAAGSVCSFAKAGVGAVASQAYNNPYLGFWGLDLLAAGRSAEQAVTELQERDPEPEKRQFAVVDSAGGAAAHTGELCDGWAGQLIADDCAVAGNMLLGHATIHACMEAFQSSSSDPLVERMIGALAAGERAGGDKRGKQSAAVYVVEKEDYPYLDLRVDDHPDPIAELRRIYLVAQESFVPLRDMMPTKTNPKGRFDFDELRRQGLLQDH